MDDELFVAGTWPTHGGNAVTSCGKWPGQHNTILMTVFLGRENKEEATELNDIKSERQKEKES